MDPNEQLDEDVEDILLQSTDGFVDFLVSKACDVAKHRKSSALEIQDLQLVLGKLMLPPTSHVEVAPALKCSVFINRCW